MRNAEYSNEGRLALQLAETGAGVAAVVFSGATGMASMYAYAAYMAAKEAASSTGGTVGVLVGAASGAASAFGTPLGVGGSLSYSYEDGFTGNLSYGKAIGDLNLGGSLNFAQGQGITGYGLSSGLKMGKGPFDQLGLNLNYMADGSFVGGALSGSSKWDSFNHGNLDRETSFRLGLNFDHTGSYTGTSTKLGLKNHFGDYDNDVHHEAGVGLTFHKAGNYDLELSSMAGADQNQLTGFYGWGAGVSGVWNFKPGGEMSGSSQNVDFEFRFQTAEQMQERYDGHQRRLAEYEAEEERFRQMWTQMFKDGAAVAYNADPQTKGAGSASAADGTGTLADVFSDDETSYAKAGFFDRFSQRLGNVFNTDCWLCTHKGVIENAGNRDGALAELRKIQELGYDLTPQQNLLKNTLERIQAEKAALLAQCECEGFIDPLKISQNMSALPYAAREKYRALIKEELSIERQHSEVIFNHRWAGEDSVGLTPYNQKLYYDFFEGRLTRDHLRDVTLHDGFFSWMLGGGAWTIGSDIYRTDSTYRQIAGGFNQFDPRQTRLLAHELTHHVQQPQPGYFWRYTKEYFGIGDNRYDQTVEDQRAGASYSLPDPSDPSKPLDRWAEIYADQYLIYEARMKNAY